MIDKEIEQIVGENNILYNENMSNHTSFKTGGPAEIFVKIEKIDTLIKVLSKIEKKDTNIHIIGNGSNVLVKDEGIKGIVIKININGINILDSNENNKVLVSIGAGEKMAIIAQKLMKNQLSGFEELSGIPGTIGGAVRMNAGAHGKEIKDIIKKVKAIDYQGNLYEFFKEEMQLEYRSSIFSKEKYIIYEVELEFEKGKQEEIKSKMDGFANWRKEHQPLEYPSAGSTFKRGKEFITAQLIDECGLKGYKIGGAEISTKHAGFIVNSSNATSKDILQLIEYTKKQVYNKFGKKIELEVEVW